MWKTIYKASHLVFVSFTTSKTPQQSPTTESWRRQTPAGEDELFLCSSHDIAATDRRHSDGGRHSLSSTMLHMMLRGESFEKLRNGGKNNGNDEKRERFACGEASTGCYTTKNKHLCFIWCRWIFVAATNDEVWGSKIRLDWKFEWMLKKLLKRWKIGVLVATFCVDVCWIVSKIDWPLLKVGSNLSSRLDRGEECSRKDFFAKHPHLMFYVEPEINLENYWWMAGFWISKVFEWFLKEEKCLLNRKRLEYCCVESSKVVMKIVSRCEFAVSWHCNMRDWGLSREDPISASQQSYRKEKLSKGWLPPLVHFIHLILFTVTCKKSEKENLSNISYLHPAAIIMTTCTSNFNIFYFPTQLLFFLFVI